MRALITGGLGFVGTWLADHLRDQGDDVVVIDRETDVTDGTALGPVLQDTAPDAVLITWPPSPTSATRGTRRARCSV